MALTTNLIADSATTVYTSSGTTALTYLSITNYTASAVDVDLHIVPSGDSAGDANLVAKELTIDAKDTFYFYGGGEKLLLDASDFISATANTATSLNCVVSYTTI
jgi:hypothetical protein